MFFIGKYNKKRVFCLAALVGFVLSNVTPLYYSSGYVGIALFIIGVVVYGQELRIDSKGSIIVLGLGICFFLYLLFSKDIFEYSYWKIAICMTLSVVLYLVIGSSKNNGGIREYNSSFFMIEDIPYAIIYIFCFLSIIRYYINGGSNTAFVYGQQYVSFSIIIMFSFMIGIKLGHKILSWLLAISTCIILPSRTFMLFITLYLLCKLLAPKIDRVINCIFHGSILPIICILSVFIVLLAYFWVFVLPNYFIMYEGHGDSLILNMYDASNFGRFGTYIYAFRVLIKEIPLFHAVGHLNAYVEIASISGGVYAANPHNSYLQLFVFYSISYGILIILAMARIINKELRIQNIPFVIPYLIVACILHDLFTSHIGTFFFILLMDQRNMTMSKFKTIRIRRKEKLNGKYNYQLPQ